MAPVYPNLRSQSNACGTWIEILSGLACTIASNVCLYASTSSSFTTRGVTKVQSTSDVAHKRATSSYIDSAYGVRLSLSPPKTIFCAPPAIAAFTPSISSTRAEIIGQLS